MVIYFVLSGAKFLIICKAYYWEGDTLNGVDFLKDRPSKLF
ncbi:hypothetical protein B4071_2623 [Bacillus subtilis]|uniref:Uncharacterized protein n=1 Tax=Bacillus subtilis subsp. subtilis TaxID=135461 RepID=A0ABD3ZWY5_BACIU|nr:hypothetical protein B4067_2979 [Bacillus subtilis subsp. subtilis]KIN28720.1 hypothetical protein B4069_2675 [Bacillus subtilis]KIN37084.1 hypothetical protein B4070_2658 [Bacillus subtilis]KIN43371.1 hypothetical protein B4071_2623 [Bacillus subtilis]KIN45816.1 hypothetical protein B4072_2731 [Bacillus subtilis]